MDVLYSGLHDGKVIAIFNKRQSRDGEYWCWACVVPLAAQANNEMRTIYCSNKLEADLDRGYFEHHGIMPAMKSAIVNTQVDGSLQLTLTDPHGNTSRYVLKSREEKDKHIKFYWKPLDSPTTQAQAEKSAIPSR